MFKTTLSAVRRATLVGVGAVSLALGASMLSAPAASAYVQAFVPVIPPATSSDAGISAPAVHDSNSVPLEHEHVVNWSDYRPVPQLVLMYVPKLLKVTVLSTWPLLRVPCLERPINAPWKGAPLR